jgi:hypothetical protein
VEVGSLFIDLVREHNCQYVPEGRMTILFNFQGKEGQTIRIDEGLNSQIFISRILKY